MFKHISVLKNETIENLNILPNGIYVDCTTGGGGHSLEIAKQLKKGKLICLDKDNDALDAAREKLKAYNKKIEFINADFADLKIWLNSLNCPEVNGIIADLGVSSYQIDTAERGFSYMQDGPLDMRMNQKQLLTAKDVVNNYSEQDLRKIMFEYGEEKNSNAIARRIVQVRELNPIETTYELKEIITKCYPPKDRYKPAIANKVFQAIRIEVNGELTNLNNAVEDMISSLKPKGRLCIITFHTLEDRIVKNAFKLHSTDCICPPNLPICVCHHKADVKLITKKPIMPSEEEQKENSRSLTAKLRIIEKI